MDRLLKWNFKRRFGLEYEFNENDKDFMAEVVKETTEWNAIVCSYRHTEDNSNTWECKPDSSCGIELASPVLKGSFQLKLAAELLTTLKDKGFNYNNNCGQHVHIEIRDFSEKQTGIMAAYWMKIEKFILNGTPDHRRNNRYCASLTEINRNAIANQTYQPEMILRDMACGRNAINFQNKRDRGTVEFRFGEMTFDPEVIKNRVRFLIWFVEMCKILPPPNNLNWLTPKQVLSTFNLWTSPNSIVKYSYSPAIQSMRKWLLSRLVEFAPNAFQKDIDKCKEILKEIESANVCDILTEECI